MALNRLLIPIIALSLGGALFFASQIETGGVSPDCAPRDPVAIENSFTEELLAMEEGRTENALLSLRKRSEKGPYPGAALYLMGEIAYAEGAWAQAFTSYRAALRKNPFLGDTGGPFGAKKNILKRIETAKGGPLKGATGKIAGDLNFLIRKLTGGCE